MDSEKNEIIMGKQRIPTDEKGFEYKKWKNKTAFPVSAGVSDLSQFCNNTFDFHWHDGPELSVVVEGQMDYLVNDKQYHMEIGDCVFVNSWAMHSGRAVERGAVAMRWSAFCRRRSKAIWADIFRKSILAV